MPNHWLNFLGFVPTVRKILILVAIGTHIAVLNMPIFDPTLPKMKFYNSRQVNKAFSIPFKHKLGILLVFILIFSAYFKMTLSYTGPDPHERSSRGTVPKLKTIALVAFFTIPARRLRHPAWIIPIAFFSGL